MAEGSIDNQTGQPDTDPSKTNKSAAQRHCEGRGGSWDEATQTCKMPQHVPKPGETVKRVGDKIVSPREFERAKRLHDTPDDPALLRRAEIQKQQNIQTATEAGLIKPTEQQGEVPIQEPKKHTPESLGYIPVEQLTFLERGNLPANAIISDELGNKFVVPEGQRIDLETGLSPFGAAVAGGITGGAIAGVALPSLSSTVSGFLSKFSAGGKVATSAKGVLSAPVKAKGISDTLKVSAGSIIAFSGLGSLKSITSNLLTKKVERIEAEVTKLGEQLTKVPEASSLGFSLDEDGKIFEYTQEKALMELEDIEDSLNEAETALQTSSIGQTFLKVTGRYDTAQAEIDKQKREITVARGKVLSQIANPSETLLNSRDFFRSLDLIE